VAEPEQINAALQAVRDQLLARQTPEGPWEGQLSASALSTATAVAALRISSTAGADCDNADALVQGGLTWLANNQNDDGGWGDTIVSKSNISTTTLCRAAFRMLEDPEAHADVIEAADGWLEKAAGGNSPDKLCQAIYARYGKDRTFAVPILTMCALSGMLGDGREAWDRIVPLPYELAALPHGFFAALKLPVVSYALPALIAIGQARFHHAPTRNPFTWLPRKLFRGPTQRKLRAIQPSSGGYLEATPLTAFVVMSQASSGQEKSSVVKHGIQFLTDSVADDGSWPIDTNLATWVTTLSVNALNAAPAPPPLPGAEHIRDWLLNQQYTTVHPYTKAKPGGWAWTDLPGGVPDADDTPGALLALHHLGVEQRTTTAAAMGIKWLLDLQNSDGGIPTFCKGWGHLPFDRSCCDLTIHALRAFHVWRDKLPALYHSRINRARDRALTFLGKDQRTDGSWLPLWFGNQHNSNDDNPVYGTAKVVVGLADILDTSDVLLRKGVNWLVNAQLADGGWGGDGKTSSLEETALALEALAAARRLLPEDTRLAGSVAQGTDRILVLIDERAWEHPSPIGFYFAKLWYYEELYPLVFAAGALGRVASLHQLHAS
jgi:squalene-hopene/tetraprenyl-beta-curcumene cyclase